MVFDDLNGNGAGCGRGRRRRRDDSRDDGPDDDQHRRQLSLHQRGAGRLHRSSWALAGYVSVGQTNKRGERGPAAVRRRRTSPCRRRASSRAWSSTTANGNMSRTAASRAPAAWSSARATASRRPRASTAATASATSPGQLHVWYCGAGGLCRRARPSVHGQCRRRACQVNFALQAQGVIQGVVFDDRSGNGRQDNGEPGVGGVTVTRSGGQQVMTAWRRQLSFNAVAVGSHAVTSPCRRVISPSAAPAARSTWPVGAPRRRTSSSRRKV